MSDNSTRKAERGSELLEFGLIVIVLFAMIFGIIDFGRALLAYHFVANAAREATRYASVRGGACNTQVPPVTDCPADQSSIQAYLRGDATGIGVDPNQLFVTANWPLQPSSPVVCSSPSSANSPGCTVQVGVSYTFNFLFPLLRASSLNMSSTSAAVITQ